MINTENKTENLISMAELIYVIYFAIMFGVRAIGLYEGMSVYNISLVLGMALFAFKIAMTEHTLIEYTMMAVLGGLSLLVYAASGEKGLLLYVTMMLGLKGVSVKRVIKAGAYIYGAALLVLILLNLTGVAEEIMLRADRGGEGSILRHTLGYAHPNTLHLNLFIFMVLCLCLAGSCTLKIQVLLSVIFMGLSLYIYLYTDSKTGFLISLAYPVVNLYLQARRNLGKAEGVLIQLIYPACVIFSVFGPVVVKGELNYMIDRFLSFRWMISNYFLANTPLTLFGIRLQPEPATGFMIDNAYLYSFLHLGVVAGIVLMILYMLMIYDCIKKQRKSELAVIICFLVMGIMEPFLFNLSFKNITFLFVGVFLWETLARIQERYPGTAVMKLQLFKYGSRQISISFFTKRKAAELVKQCGLRMKRYWYAYVVLFAAVGLLTGISSSVVTTAAKVLYVDERLYEKNVLPEEAWYPLDVSKEEVKALEAEGALIYGYEEEEPLYELSRETSLLKREHFLRCVSIGVWSGAAATVIAMCVGTMRGMEPKKKV